MPAPTPLLTDAFLHGGYHVYFDVEGRHWVAETSPEEDLWYFLQLRSVLRQRVIDAIGEIRGCADNLPIWLERWSRGEECCIYLDPVERRSERQR